MKIPKDLVLLPDIDYLTDEEIELVDRANWFEIDGWLFASAKEINYLSEVPPEELGINIRRAKIQYIPHILHRWDEEGFYHA